MSDSFTPPSIVVGIDGSRAAVHAALWAVDEAIGRDFPLRLLAAAEPPDGRDRAETAVRSAAAAIESAVAARVEVLTEVVAGTPTSVLVDASHTAAMVCVGAVGLKHFEHNPEHYRTGSTASTLVASAHCPVAVVRGGDRPVPATPGWVVVQLDQTPDSAAVLQYAVGEARMRSAPLRVLGTWQSDDHGGQSVAESGRLVRAQLDRRLENWRHRYPDLDVVPVAVHGSGLGYLAENAASIRLVVIGAANTAGLDDLLGSAGLAALRDNVCPVLVVDRQQLL